MRCPNCGKETSRKFCNDLDALLEHLYTDGECRGSDEHRMITLKLEDYITENLLYEVLVDRYNIDDIVKLVKKLVEKGNFDGSD